MDYLDLLNTVDDDFAKYIPSEIFSEHSDERWYTVCCREADAAVSCGAVFSLNEYGAFAELLYIYVLEEYRGQGRGSELLMHCLGNIYDRGIRRVRCVIKKSIPNEDRLRNFLVKNGLELSYEESFLITVSRDQIRNMDMLALAANNDYLMSMEGIFSAYDDANIDLIALHTSFYSMGLCVYDTEGALGVYSLTQDGELDSVLLGKLLPNGGYVLTDYADSDYGVDMNAFKRLFIAFLIDYIKNASVDDDLTITCNNGVMAEFVRQSFGWKVEEEEISVFQGVLVR